MFRVVLRSVVVLAAAPANGSMSRTSRDACCVLEHLDHCREEAMIDGSQRVEFNGVEVLANTGLVLTCRIDGKVVALPPLRRLPGARCAGPVTWALDPSALRR